MDCKFLHVLCFDVKIKAKNSNNPPREKNSRTDITMATVLLKQEFFCQSAHDLHFIRLLSPTKCLYRDKKLNSILRRHYCFIMTALGENIFATSPDTECIFSQPAVITKP